MLITAIENFVLFSTLLSLAAFAFSYVARRAANNGLWFPRAATLTRLYTAALVFPPVTSAWLVIAALLPEFWLGRSGFDAAHPAPLHELHLLSDVTARLEPTLGYATALFIAGVVVFAAWSSVRNFFKVGSVIKRLEMTAAQPPAEQVTLVETIALRHGLEVGLVLSNYPFSFVWGFSRSKLVLSSGLLCSLTAEELTGVLEHEAAHHQRRDNLVKLFLSCCSRGSIAFPLSRMILAWRAEQVEIVCDEVASARTSAPLEIAEALVKLRRQTAPVIAYAPTGASSFVPQDLPSFELRVHRLLALADDLEVDGHLASLAPPRISSLFAIAAVFSASLMSLFLLAPLAVHHAIESLIQLV
ncbi:MAG: M48 family metalloprotease [Pyrinomonadaceae bacterium]|nr:M48 family metalloprotease [Pyrinomonadaceae bacterium]